MGSERGESGEVPSSQAESLVYFSNPLMSDIESDWSPLHDAAYHGRLLSVCNLIDQGTSINLVSLDKVSPLHVACLQGHTACAKLLIDQGANVNATTVDRNTPLSYACAGGHLSCVRLLLQRKATPHGPADSASPIHQAAAKGHAECLEALVQQGADVDRHSEYLGADVNSGKGWTTPLHLGARQDCPELVSSLLDHGANPNARDTAGNRPLDLAPPNGAAQTLLIQREAGVPHLMQLCRLTVRRALGRARLGEISFLLLPLELKEYLLYQSVLQDRETKLGSNLKTMGM